eukprot:SAG31_NODE_8971_length_1355_cov_1.338376_2_plen_129_part_00
MKVQVGIATLAGAAAGATETLFHTPFEVVKIRMQAERGRLASTASDGAASPLTIAYATFRREGVAGLYTGLGAYALRQVVWNGAFFGGLGFGKSLQSTEAAAGPVWDFGTGLMAGSFATWYPHLFVQI